MITKKLTDRLKYMTIFKDVHREAVQDKHKNDPLVIFFNQCNIDQELVLPVLEYVHDKTLCLQSYTLSIGHANALAKCMERIDNNFINRVIFDNCGIDDEEFASILRGIQ